MFTRGFARDINEAFRVTDRFVDTRVLSRHVEPLHAVKA